MAKGDFEVKVSWTIDLTVKINSRIKISNFLLQVQINVEDKVNFAQEQPDMLKSIVHL